MGQAFLVLYLLFVLYFFVAVLKDKKITKREKTNFSFLVVVYPIIGIVLYLLRKRKTSL